MRIFIDADASPVTWIVEDIAHKYQVECKIVCDHNHLIKSDVCEVVMVDTGSDSADIKISNDIKKNDILITQDYGLASVALAKQALILNHFGKEYTLFNIDSLLLVRHINQVNRRSSKYRGSNQRKRLKDDDIKFEEALVSLIKRLEKEELE